MNTTERLEHYTALMTHLSNEKQRLAAATTKGEIELRSVWVAQLEKEIAHALWNRDPNAIPLNFEGFCVAMKKLYNL